ncbi:MAG: Phosphoheptose isomerase, partial [uncultured Solirubrobacteraceae bacterium]
ERTLRADRRVGARPHRPPRRRGRRLARQRRGAAALGLRARRRAERRGAPAGGRQRGLGGAGPAPDLRAGGALPRRPAGVQRHLAVLGDLGADGDRQRLRRRRDVRPPGRRPRPGRRRARRPVDLRPLAQRADGGRGRRAARFDHVGADRPGRQPAGARLRRGDPGRLEPHGDRPGDPPRVRAPDLHRLRRPARAARRDARGRWRRLV